MTGGSVLCDLAYGCMSTAQWRIEHVAQDGGDAASFACDLDLPAVLRLLDDVQPVVLEIMRS